jgi:hypothetical protein
VIVSLAARASDSPILFGPSKSRQKILPNADGDSPLEEEEDCEREVVKDGNEYFFVMERIEIDSSNRYLWILDQIID